MIGLLGGNRESAEAFTEAIGKTITDLRIRDEEALEFTFKDGTRLALFDDGQSCCEHRWMHTDDDLAYYVGSDLQGAEVREGPEVEDSYEVKESEFLIVTTTKGQFTVVNYNEHNGYYGGFLIRARTLPPVGA